MLIRFAFFLFLSLSFLKGFRCWFLICCRAFDLLNCFGLFLKMYSLIQFGTCATATVRRHSSVRSNFAFRHCYCRSTTPKLHSDEMKWMQSDGKGQALRGQSSLRKHSGLISPWLKWLKGLSWSQAWRSLMRWRVMENEAKRSIMSVSSSTSGPAS